MKNEALFNKTVGILVKAYINETLLRADCAACAVGNIVAGNNGYDIKIIIGGNCFGDNSAKWVGKKHPAENGWGNAACLFIVPENYTGEAKRQIDSTGYSIKQVRLIEDAFMYPNRNVINAFTGKWSQYKGLMSVVDCLMQIHEATTEEATAAKELFTTA